MVKSIAVLIGGFIGFALGYVLIMLLLIPLAILRGFVITKMWMWFIVPTFGLPVLSIAQAIGVAMVAGLLTNEYASLTQQDDPKKKTSAITTALLTPFMTLLIGWVVKMFI